LAVLKQAAEARARLVERMRLSSHENAPAIDHPDADMDTPVAETNKDSARDIQIDADDPNDAPVIEESGFPLAALAGLDIDEALGAWENLSNNGFDRDHGWHDVHEAIGYIHRLGYRGPESEAREHLGRLIDLHRQSMPVYSQTFGAPVQAQPGPAAGNDIKPLTGHSETANEPSAAIVVSLKSSCASASQTLSVADLIKDSAVSVRLSNIALRNSLFDEWTIASAQAQRHEFVAAVYRLTNMGKKTVEEVETLLDGVKDGFSPSPAVAVGSPPSLPHTASIRDLVEISEISMRLYNVARSNSIFDEWTIADALSWRSDFIRQLYCLTNMGRKTVKELEAILENFAISGNTDVPANPEMLDGTNFEAIGMDTTLVEVLRLSTVSRGLADAISQNALGELTVYNYLADKSELAQGFMALPNFAKHAHSEAFAILDRMLGMATAETRSDKVSSSLSEALDEPIKSILEYQNVSTRLANVAASGSLDRFALKDFARDRLGFEELILDFKNAGRNTARELGRILSTYIVGLGEQAKERVDEGILTDAAQVPMETLTPLELLTNAIQALPPREAQVLRSRYGLDSETPRTLQEIGVQFHVSRERVRQVEKNALLMLQKGPGRLAVVSFINEHREAQWSVLGGLDSRIRDEDVTERAKSLDPLFALAVDVLHGSVREWLAAFAHRDPIGWIRDSSEATRRSVLVEKIMSIIRTCPTPIPPHRLHDLIGEDFELTTLTSLETNDWAIFEDYLCVGYIGATARRTVRLHKIARTICTAGLVDIGSIVKAYRASHPEDMAASRIIEMQIEKAPHLFAQFLDSFWLVLPLTGQEGQLTSLPFEHDAASDSEFNEESGGGQIMLLLERNGPMRLTDILREVMSNGALAKSSVGAILASNPCFRRVAPGYFALYRGDQELKRLWPSLLNENHCKMFCMARRSGAPSDYYPAWGAEFEMELVKWTKASGSPELFRSLMSVVQPIGWPLPPEIIVQMLAVRNQEAHWSLGFERKDALGKRFIDTDQFVAILAHLAILGWIGWFAVNRLSGTISSQNDAADVLAFLILAGLVAPCDDWQARHEATDLAKSTFLAFANQRYNSGEVNWRDDIMVSVMKRLDHVPACLGWVNADEAALAIAAWRTGELSTGRAYGGGGTVPVDADETFGSAEWESIFGDAG
jgi:hypothetical protein